MQRKISATTPPIENLGRDDGFDLDALLHPAQAFDHPLDVVKDPDLTLSEKRAILASWASDACAVEAVPSLRSMPGRIPVRFDDIMDALRQLDGRAGRYKPQPRYRRVLRERIPGMFGRNRRSPDDHGRQPN